MDVNPYSSMDVHLREKDFVEVMPPISISRNSVVVKARYDNLEAVVKSYDPRRYVPYYEEFIHNSQPPITMEGGYKKSDSFYFTKELQVLTVLNMFQEGRVISNLIPEFYGGIPQSKKILMEFVEGRTIRDLLVEIEEKAQDPIEKEKAKKPIQEQLLNYIATFHREVNQEEVQDNLLALRYRKKPTIYFRNREEEKQRLSHYTRLIVFSHSEEFREKYKINENWKYSPQKWKSLKRDISKYLHSKGIDFKEFIEGILVRHRKILYSGDDLKAIDNNPERLVRLGRISVVHGDFGPQNVVSRKDKPENHKTIDFNEFRLDTFQVELVHGLYHVASNPSEANALELLYGLYESQIEGVEWNDFLPEHIETRLFEGVRKIASDARMSRHELLKFAGATKTAKYTNTEYLRRYNFELHQKFLAFYRDGEGRSAISTSRDKDSLLLDQIDDFARFFHQITTRGTGFQRALYHIGKKEVNGNSK